MSPFFGTIAVAFAALPIGCGGETESTPPTRLPCAVDAVMKDVCQTCHGSPPTKGAPIALVTYSDTQAPFDAPPMYKNAPTWKVIGDVVASGWMPQPWPGVSLSHTQKQTLLDWVADGAPPAGSGDTCK